MKTLNLIYVLVLCVLIEAFPQQEQNEEIKISFGGYVNWTAIYDSRQVVAARESHFLLYPKPEQLNLDGKDLNDIENLQMAVIQTRLSSKITGLNFLGASTSGLVEAEFMGNADTDVNGFRIRHAFVNLKWDNIDLLLGQYWNPMFNTEMFPDQIGSNGGAPFQPFARNPQIRLTHQTGALKTIFAVVTQRDYVSTGPNGSSSEYLKNAIIPDVHLQFNYKIGSNLFGIGGQYKKLKPGAKNGTGIINDETVSSYSVIGLTKLTLSPITIKLEGVYGSNLTDYTMIGGYARQSIDTVTNIETFTPIKTFAAWADIVYGQGFELGLFLGYTKNLGSENLISSTYYSRGSNIDRVTRIAPRVQYKEGNLKVALEFEYTTAYYGITDSYGKVNQSNGVSNTRIYTSVYYFFL